METKLSKIENFLNSLEQNELTEQQASMMLKAGLSGEGGPSGPSGPDGDKNKHNCNASCNNCNMVPGCGK